MKKLKYEEEKILGNACCACVCACHPVLLPASRVDKLQVSKDDSHPVAVKMTMRMAMMMRMVMRMRMVLTTGMTIIHMSDF